MRVHFQHQSIYYSTVITAESQQMRMRSVLIQA